MALMQLNVTPLGTETTSVGQYVAEFEKMLKNEKISHFLTDMGTIIEGDVQTLLEITAKIHEIPFQKGAMRVVTQMTIDDRRDKKVSLGDKVSSVQARLG